MNFLKLAFRNVFRNKRRTLITLLSLWLGGSVIILVKGYMDYTFWGLREMTIRSELGHIQVYKKGYLENGKDMNFLLTSEDLAVLQNFTEENKKDIEVFTARLGFSGIITGERKQSFFLGEGIIPLNERKISSNLRIVSGTDSIKEKEIIIGEILAENLKASTGDMVTLLSNTTYGSLNAMDFKVKGVVSNGVKAFDEKLVRVNLSDASKLIGTEKVEKGVILLYDTSKTSDIMARMQKNSLLNQNFSFRSWNELSDYYEKVTIVYKNIFGFLTFVIFIVIIFSVSNTITMSVMERISEIGILRSIGTYKTEIFQMMFYEGVIIGILGGIGASIFGVILAFVINIFGGIYMSPPPGHTEGYYILITPLPSAFLLNFIVCLFSSAISGVFGAIKASRLVIINAINHV